MQVIVLAHNIRSTYNVGSLLRTADGFGVAKFIASGYTPYPVVPNDTRLPHIARKLSEQIHKSALGAEQYITVELHEYPPLNELRAEGYQIVGLEQAANAVPLPLFKPSRHIALLLGEERDGIPEELQNACDALVEIPMLGRKESFNVSVAAGIALYHLRNQ